MAALRLVFLLFGAALGVLFPFTSVIFAGRGFDPAEIGLVTALSAGAYALAVPAWGHLGDVTLGRRRALRVATLGAAAALVAFGLPLPGLVIGGAYIVFTLTGSAVGPMSDALAMNALRRDRGGDYGGIRLFTSLAYAVTSIVAGLVFDATGYGPAPFVTAALLLLAGAVAGLVADIPRADLSGIGRGRRGGSARAAFATERRLPIVLLAIGLAFLGEIAVFIFLPLRIQELGGSPSDIALSAGLSAAAEVPGFLIAGWLAPRLGLRALFLVSVAATAGCILSYTILDTPGPIILVRTVSGLGFAGFSLASVVTIAALLPPALQGTGQALLATTTSGVAAALAGAVGGIVYGSAGPRALFAIMAAAALASAVVGWLALPGRIRVRGGGPEVLRPARGSSPGDGDGLPPATMAPHAEVEGR